MYFPEGTMGLVSLPLRIRSLFCDNVPLGWTAYSVPFCQRMDYGREKSLTLCICQNLQLG